MRSHVIDKSRCGGLILNSALDTIVMDLFFVSYISVFHNFNKIPWSSLTLMREPNYYPCVRRRVYAFMR